MRDFKYIKNEIAEEGVMEIAFFSEFNEYTVKDFINEFKWLEFLQPNAIKILINSEGGSVLRGMNMFSTILNCPIKTIGQVEGLAASMGSVILAACDEIKMRDYARVMIHNPFDSTGETDDEDDATKNFTEMLQGIYTSRWGIDEEKMKSIMDGEEGKDGTWLNSKEAVKLGIVDKKNIIKTVAQKKKEVDARLISAKNNVELVDVYASIIKKDGEQSKNSKTIFLQKGCKSNLETNNDKNMDEKITAVSSILSVEADKVVARVTELSKVEAKVAGLETAKAQLEDSVKAKDIEIEALKASVANTKESFETVSAELKTYKAKEEAAAKKERADYFKAAVEAGKIKEDSVEGWNKLAETNFDLVKSSIDSIEAVQKPSLTEEIEASAAEEIDGKQKTGTEVDAEKAKAERIAKLKAAGIDPETFEFKKL